jgi:hypothetical protein
MDKSDLWSLLRNIDPGVLIPPFLGFLFIGVGLATMYFIGRVNTLTCSRDITNNQTCALITTWMGLTELSVRPLPQLTSAYVQDNCDEDGCTYRVMLSTRFGDLPLTSIYSSGKVDKQQKAEQVRLFLQDNSQAELKISEGGGLFILFPLIFIGMGLFLCTAALANLFLKPTAT